MKHVITMRVFESYINARLIADYTCIALMRYSSTIPKPTYTATIKRRNIRNELSSNVPSNEHITDETTCYYLIRIRRLEGSRGSILSPSQNEYFKKVIASDEMLSTLSEIEGTKKPS